MEFVTVDSLRSYLLQDQIDPSDTRYGDGPLGSNIRAASAFLQRQTRRQFEPQTTTKKFTTNGRFIVPTVDLRSVTSVEQQGVALTADETYWLLPDPIAPEVFTRIQVRLFSGGDYRSNPQWFDRNLDRDWRRGWATGSLPNDLEIAGAWGHSPYPEDLMMATKVLAAWYTKRPDSVLANVSVSLEGSELRYGELPPEVVAFISVWRLRDEMVVVG